MYRHCMLDLETLNITADSVVCTIGALVFDYTGMIYDRFYKRVDIESCKKLNLTVSDKTLQFWNTQPEEVKAEIFSPENREDIKDCIEQFTEFFNKHSCREIWCNGANFDEPILSLIYSRLGMETPWKFFNVRCLRTLMYLHNKNIRDFCRVVKHHALDDCNVQVNAVVYCINIKRNNT